MREFFAAGFVLLVGVCSANQLLAAEPAVYRVGVAQKDITPDYPIRLSGFGFRRAESEGVTQKIWTKALAIQPEKGDVAVLLTTDNLGVPLTVTNELARRLEQKVGLKRDRLTVTATHTHTAPMLSGVAATLFSLPIPPDHQSRIDRYTKDLTDRMEQAALTAIQDMAPAHLSWGLGSVKFAINRRTAGGPVDHDLPVLFVKDLQGKVRAVYVNYACHCVTLSDNKISGDWAGYAQDLIQREFPQATALLSVGCGADSNPKIAVTGGKTQVAEAQGLEIAAEVKRLSLGYLTPLQGGLKTQWRSISLRFAPPPSREEFLARVKKGGYVGYHAQVQLARLDRGEPLQSVLEYPIQTWSFGTELAMVFLPGEVVVDYSLRLKRELDGQRLWVTAYANDEPCYIPSERILKEGGYEGGDAMTYYDRPSRLQPGLEKQIVDVVHAQLDEAFGPKFDAAGTSGSLPKSPQQSLATLRTHPNLQVDLVVAEPLIADPVAVDFGPEGNLWVAEMHDYPSGTAGNFQPGGRVRLVKDINHDGRYDQSSIFLENIPFPTGITVWRDGVLVCAAPDILFARDVDGDGRADEVKKLYTGFGTDNYQARVNSLSYGLDGWVYGSCGLFGGRIKNLKGGEFALGDRDFRIKPDTGELEPATGRTQQGRVRDDWDNWFGCDNSNLCRHYPLAERYLRRNPHYISPITFVNVPGGENSNRLFPATQRIQRFKLSGPENNVTAACGLGIYRDTVLGQEYQGNSFTCEPVNLLVHRMKLNEVGSSFTGHRADDELESEFLAGTDEWFRPVQAKTGPDGGLWVVDMYRFVIEHPRWIPPQTVAQLDVRAGHSMGRIYRVRNRHLSPPPTPRLDQLDGLGLTRALETENGWQRDLVSQMLLWRYGPGSPSNPNDLKNVVASLEGIVQKSKRPAARLHALCVLDVLDQLSPAVNLLALKEASPQVRRHAIRVAERHATTHSELAQALATPLETDAQVALQQACSLGYLPSDQSGKLLYQLAEIHCQNPIVMAGIMSSLNGENVVHLLNAAMSGPETNEFHKRVFPQIVGQAFALGQARELPRMIEFITRKRDGGWQPWQFEAIAQIVAAMHRPGIIPAQRPNAEVAASIQNLLNVTRQLLKDEHTPLTHRVAILQLLGRDPEQQAEELQILGELLRPQTDPELQSRIVETLGRFNTAQVPEILVANWVSHSPARQTQILDLLLSRPSWTKPLLELIAAKTVPANQLDAIRRQRLTSHSDAGIRDRAKELLAGSASADRVQVLEQYQIVATLKGDPKRGEALFTKSCATCHRLGNIGRAVGPDLAALANKSPQFLLQEILDPNRNVDTRFVQYTVVLNDGRILVGILAGESANGLTLRTSEGKEVQILRSEIEEIASTGKSLMPEGLEKDLDQAALADLISFVTRVQTPAKTFPGNTPRVVTAVNGQFTLSANCAEIRGNSIVFEEPFQNIGYWHGIDDQVTWDVTVSQPGEFDLYLDFACAPDSAGNDFVLNEAQPLLSGKVPSTGGWDRYRQQNFGTISLTQGSHRLTLSPAGPELHGALLDLKGVYLVPKGMVLALAGDVEEPADPKKVSSLVAKILNEEIPPESRQALITQNPKLARDLIAGMTDGLTSGTAEEYRRIPWIWRVAIAAGRRNDIQEIRTILDVSLPQPNLPLHDWRAVVIGGGIINGISLEGHWPMPRLAEVLKEQGALTTRWQMALDEAAKMVEDLKVPVGTRYDALRMVALDRWERRGIQLEKYLAAGVHPELQMGAVSGLVDVDQPVATSLLISALNHLPEANRNLALEGLLRGDARQKALIEALEKGVAKSMWLNANQRSRLLMISDAAWRERAHKILK